MEPAQHFGSDVERFVYGRPDGVKLFNRAHISLFATCMISDAMQRSGLKKKDVAKRAGITKRRLKNILWSDYELDGESPPTIDELADILTAAGWNALETPVSWPPEPPSLSPQP